VSTLLPHVGPSIFQAVSDLQIAMQWRDDRGQLVTDDLTSAAHASWIDSASTKTGPVPKESVVESVRNWQQVHPHGFPPVIVHMTDGSQFPSQLEGLLRELLDSKPIQSSEPLLFNCVVPHHKAVGTLMLPALDDPPFEDLTLVSIWQNSSTLPRPLARRLQGEEEVLQRFCCFCLAASRDAASQFLHHVFRLLPETGTIQSRARALSDLDSIRRTQRETQYKRVAETRARLQDARARRAYIVSVVALAISIVALLFTLLKFFVAGK
jgi:hypothetical protein